MNRTGKDIELSVFLVDDDDNLENIFPYAYQVNYTNNDHTEETIMTPAEYNVWKSVATFTIPSSGNAEESSYTS